MQEVFVVKVVEWVFFKDHIPHIQSDLGVRRQFMDKNVDFYMTLPCIDEYDYGYSNSIIVMSQKAYQFLTEKQMTRALKIEPLETI